MPINVLSLDPSFWGSSTSCASAGAAVEGGVDPAAASVAGAAVAGVAAAAVVDEDENAHMVRSASETCVERTGVGRVSRREGKREKKVKTVTDSPRGNGRPAGKEDGYYLVDQGPGQAAAGLAGWGRSAAKRHPKAPDKNAL